MPSLIATYFHTLKKWSKLLLYLSCALLFLLANSLKAQSFIFNPVNIESGLQSNEVFDMLQDQEGYIYFATNNGLMRYNGNAYKRIELEDETSPSGTDLCMNRAGEVFYMGFNGVVYKVDGAGLKLVKDVSDEVKGFPDILMLGDLLWVATGQHFYQLNTSNDAVQKFKHSDAIVSAPSLLNQKGTALTYADKTGVHQLNWETKKTNLLLSEEGHFRYFEMDDKSYIWNTWKNGKDKLYRFVDENSLKQVETALSDTLEQHNGSAFDQGLGYYWFGTTDGLLYSKDKKEFEFIFKDLLISDILIDSENQLWVSSTTKGVFLCKDIGIQYYTEENSFLKYNEVTAVSPYRDGMVLGYYNGWLSLRNDSTVQHIQLDKNAGEVDAIAICGNTILAARNDLYLFENGEIQNILQSVGSFRVMELANDSLLYYGNHRYVRKAVFSDKWAGADPSAIQAVKGVHFFDGKKTGHIYPVADKGARALYYDDGRIYIATDKGIEVHSGKEKTSLTLNGEPIIANKIISVENQLWLACRSGILIFENHQFQNKIDKSDGLPSNKVLDLLYAHGNVFAVTNEGLSLINPENLALEYQWSPRNKVDFGKITDLAVVDSSLMIASLNGLFEIGLDYQPAPHIQPVLKLKEVLQEDSVIATDNIELPFGFAPVSFRFEVIAPKAENNIQIRYRLSEKEAYSSISIENPVLDLYRLSEGHYELEVFAENEAGMQSEIIRVPILVHPPFTRSIWFYLLLIGLAASITALFFLYRLYFVKKRLTLQRQLKDSELKAVKSQMNPHFIFNLLNSIQYLITKGDNERAYQYINRFAKLVRNTLDYSEQKTIPLFDEIKLLRVYLELEELRFSEDFQYEIQTDELTNVQIPPLLIQPFIENALVHGLLHKKGSKKLKVRFTVGDVVTCIIEDNGVGREKAKSIRQRQRGSYKSFATMAIEKRFALLRENYSKEIGFRYEDLNPTEEDDFMTRVTIRIPYTSFGK